MVTHDHTSVEHETLYLNCYCQYCTCPSTCITLQTHCLHTNSKGRHSHLNWLSFYHLKKKKVTRQNTMRNANRSVKTKSAVCEKAGFPPSSYKHIFSSCTHILGGKRTKYCLSVAISRITVFTSILMSDEHSCLDQSAACRFGSKKHKYLQTERDRRWNKVWFTE